MDERTALHIAANAGATEVVSCLLMAKPNLDKVSTTSAGSRPFYWKLDDIGSNIIKATKKYVLFPLQEDMDSSTPLILAAAQGFTDVVNLLASAGCDLDQRNSEGSVQQK